MFGSHIVEIPQGNKSTGKNQFIVASAATSKLSSFYSI